MQNTLIRVWCVDYWAVKSAIDKSHSLKQISEWKITPVSGYKKNHVLALQSPATIPAAIQ